MHLRRLPISPHSIFLSGICWLILVSVANAHPVSHTDAWIRVSDSVDVRLNIFLDDVLRHQSLLPDAGNTIPGSVVAAAIKAHHEILLEQLRIFDSEGRPLSGRITSVPKWPDTGADVDLSVDASLKLTWKMVFQQTGNGLQQLSFLHHFTHPTLDSTGELRLHLQDKRSNRRFDAVIPAERFHTVILPQSQPGIATSSTPDQVEANQLISRLVVGPTHVTIEFESPLTLMNIAWPDVESFTNKPLANKHSTVLTLDQDAANNAQASVRKWFADNVSLAINGQVARPVGIKVEFLPGLIGQSTEVESSAFSPVPIFGSRIGVRLSYERGLNISDVELHLLKNPSRYATELQMHLSTGQEHSTQVQTIMPELSAADHCFAFTWKNKLSSELPEKFSQPAIYQLIETQKHYPSVKGLIGCGVLIAIWCLAVFKLPRLRQNVSSKMTTSLAVIASSLIPVALFPASSLVVSGPDLTRAMGSHISGIYEALQLNNEQQTVTALGTILEDEIRELTYLNTLKSLNSTADEPIASLRSVEVAECDFASPNSESHLTATCQWTVGATVEHWGHSHDRKLMFSGQVQLVKRGLDWKIRTFRPVQSKIVLSDQAEAPES